MRRVPALLSFFHAMVLTRMLSVRGKTHQGVTVAAVGETLSHQVMCLERFFQLRGFVGSEFLSLCLGLDEGERHSPKILYAGRKFLNGLFAQAGLLR